MVLTCVLALAPTVNAAAAAASSWAESHTPTASTAPNAKWNEPRLPPRPAHMSLTAATRLAAPAFRMPFTPSGVYLPSNKYFGMTSPVYWCPRLGQQPDCCTALHVA